MDARPLIQQPSFPPPPPPPPPIISSISNPQFPPLQQIPQPQSQSQPQVVPQPPPQLPPTIIPSGDHVAAEAQISKRRRTSGPGSRGVNNLTPEQLAKKRANDREAQRAIRERTKGQIEALEKKIQDLTSQKPYQELQDALRQKELVEAENADIKRRMAAIQSLVQPILAPTTVNRLPSLPTTQTTTVTPTMSTNDAAAVLSQSLPVPAQGFDPVSVRSSASTASTYAASPSTIKHTPPQTNFPPSTNGLSPGSALPRHPSNPASFPVRGQDEKLALDYLMASRNSSRDSNPLSERTPSSSASRVLPMDTISQTPSSASPTSRLEGPVCSMPIRNIPPTCPLDGLLLDFLADQRRQALEGIPISEIIGPPYACFASLINPTRRLYSHPLSKIFTEMLATFPDISTLPEQVAILHLMYLLMRYALSPTPENHDRLPHWFQPRPSQLLTPHPAWTDYLPWPRMRDKLVQIYPHVPFDEFFIPYTTTVSLNWPHGQDMVLVPAPAEGVGVGAKTATATTTTGGAVAGAGVAAGDFVLTAAFEEHMMDLGNWSLGPAFARAHPALAGTVKIK